MTAELALLGLGIVLLTMALGGWIGDSYDRRDARRRNPRP